MPDLPIEVEEVRVLRLQPGDVLVAKVSDRITPETVEAVKWNLESAFPGYRVIVVSGIDLEVARPEHIDGSGGSDQ